MAKAAIHRLSSDANLGLALCGWCVGKAMSRGQHTLPSAISVEPRDSVANLRASDALVIASRRCCKSTGLAVIVTLAPLYQMMVRIITPRPARESAHANAIAVDWHHWCSVLAADAIGVRNRIVPVTAGKAA
eukprot:CAMPEP_0178432096 /NCGR_PEP_ID=MMETSP0689_2-20121128/32201_1 /TAXON_ID=160604 /ORGANISM="Amphidinium massartii, Strain CS-259" /LENGTH=131 /DNA_ID=CAMNT_0020054057 /DNA_START=687 /DNA_END=1082 /DNA_ORIENTATION=-